MIFKETLAKTFQMIVICLNDILNYIKGDINYDISNDPLNEILNGILSYISDDLSFDSLNGI